MSLVHHFTALCTESPSLVQGSSVARSYYPYSIRLSTAAMEEKENEDLELLLYDEYE